MADIPIKGTPEEQRLYMEVKPHTDMAEQDLQTRIMRKNGFDDADKLFNNYIDENKWPYQAVTFDPRISTAIMEKNARLIANKPKGRLVPREGGDELGAFINNELLSYQWDDVSRVDDPMVAKWQMMDLNARRYGAAFGVASWRYQTRAKMEGDKPKKKVLFDGPFFKVLNARDALPNPSYSNIKNWFQYREWVTFQELQSINDSSRSEPKYKNLNLLREALQSDSKTKGGDGRQVQYINKSKQIRGLDDFLGRDWVFKTIEVITEMRPDRWITYAPRHGVILRDIPNPYNHGEIPAIMLRYYPLGDDLYGFSEIEQTARLQKAINALVCQYLDNINAELYPPIVVDPTRVQMHTLELGPNTKWQVNGDVNTAIKRLDISTSATQNFTQAYSLLVASLQNALGETSAAFSNLKPFGQEKTATEVKETSFTKTVRDNANQIFLSEAIKKQYMLWHSMNQQFLFKGGEKTKIIRIVGDEAIRYFQDQGMDQIHPTEQDALEGNDMLNGVPVFPVEGGSGLEPKLSMDSSGKGGQLVVEPGDLEGLYDFIPDIESMQPPSASDIENRLQLGLGLLSNPVVAQGLAAQGDEFKYKDYLVKILETGDVLKNADQYFQKAQSGLGGAPGQPGMTPSPLDQGGMNAQAQVSAPGAVTPGAGPGGPGVSPIGIGGNPGVQGLPQAMVGA